MKDYTISRSTLERFAHCATLHYGRLQEMEGKLPPDERAIMEEAIAIECLLPKHYKIVVIED